MVARLHQPSAPPAWIRWVEWAVVALVVLGLIAFYTQHSRRLQGQAELAAVRATVGALRSALVIEHLRQVVAGERASMQVPPNPFDLLKQPPLNYSGVRSASSVRQPLPGHWFFDPACPCVAYAPTQAQWLDTYSADGLLWFRLQGGVGRAFELTAQAPYVWQSQSVN